MAVSAHNGEGEQQSARRDKVWPVRRGHWRLQSLLGLLASSLVTAFDREQDRWFLWSPVALGLGIGAYFNLDDEPHWGLVLLPLFLGLGTAWHIGASQAKAFALALAVAIAGLGGLAAKSRTYLVAAPTLKTKLGPVMVEGWVQSLSMRNSGRVAAIVLVDKIEDLAGPRTPEKIQLTMARGLAPEAAGVAIRVLAMLRPPPRPVAPGAYDFSRRAFFNQIGAYGHTLTKPLLNSDVDASSQGLGRRWAAWISRVRATAAARIITIVGEGGGPIAAALLTGMRGAIPKPDIGAIRDAGLAHLLAISGLHMALMSGAAFWAVRFLIALMPWLALRVVGKKWAAAAGLLTGTVYYFLAGGSVATERAYIMVVVALVAVIVDRPAISLRNVALAAAVILFLKPETLVEVGFQMSFAAVLALTAFYERVTRWQSRRHEADGHHETSNVATQIFKVVVGVVVTTLIASLATGPLAAFQFNRVAIFGLAANVVAVPLVGFAVMPLGLLALVLMPFGLDAPALALMGAGTGALLDIARTVASWPGATQVVASPSGYAIPVFAIGGLWLCLWRGRWRYWGLTPIIAVIGLAGYSDRPDIYFGEDSRRIAVRGQDGQLSLSKGLGGRYLASQWLRRNADSRRITDATSGINAGGPLSCDRQACAARMTGADGVAYRLAFVRHASALAEACQHSDIVLSSIPLYGKCQGPVITIDRFELFKLGTHTLTLGKNGPVVRNVSTSIGNRPWNRRYVISTATAPTRSP